MGSSALPEPDLVAKNSFLLAMGGVIAWVAVVVIFFLL
jgi:hypothetical protein